MLAEHKLATPFALSGDWVFTTARGTPHGHRNITRRGLGRAADSAGLNTGEWPPLRFHDLRHTFASHLILDLGLDVAALLPTFRAGGCVATLGPSIRPHW
jgi:integrase